MGKTKVLEFSCHHNRHDKIPKSLIIINPIMPTVKMLTGLSSFKGFNNIHRVAQRQGIKCLSLEHLYLSALIVPEEQM